MACENNNPEWHKLFKIQKRTYIRTTLLLLMVHLGKGFFNHFCFLTHSVSIFFSAVSYPPSTRTVCNLSVSFLTKRMSIKLSTKFTQRSDVIPCLDKHKTMKIFKQTNSDKVHRLLFLLQTQTSAFSVNIAVRVIPRAITPLDRTHASARKDIREITKTVQVSILI